MSIRYYLDQDRHLWLTVMEGTITLEDLFTYVDIVIAKVKRFEFNELITLGEITTRLTSDEISELASRTNASHDSGQPNCMRTAVVAPSKLGFGLSRVFQSHQSRSSKAFAVFKDMKRATDWLELENSPDTCKNSLADWTYIGPAFATH